MKDKQKIYKKTLELIDKHKLIFIEDVVSFLPLTKTTFYDYFKINSNEMNTIKDKLDENKVKLKVNLRKKWYESDNATLQMGIYKLLANEEELERLNNKERVTTSEVPKLSITLNGINGKTK